MRKYKFRKLYMPLMLISSFLRREHYYLSLVYGLWVGTTLLNNQHNHCLSLSTAENRGNLVATSVFTSMK